MMKAASAEHRQEVMTLLFSLAIPAEAQKELEARVARGEVVPPEELQKRYAVGKGDVKVLVDWLKKEGFKVGKVTKDGTAVYASARVDQIEKSLGVEMVRVTKDGLTFTAARNAPSLPAEVAGSVHAIVGLQPFRRAHKHGRKQLPTRGNRASVKSGSAATPSPNVANAPPYLVREILKTYNADGLSVTGKGQTIAILIDTFPVDSDVRTFWRRNSIPGTTSRIAKINVKGGTLPAPEGEETLDVEWSSGIAPGAKIRVYASGTLAWVDLDAALDQIIADTATQPGMRQLSVSLGLGETFMPAGEVQTQQQKFLRLAAAGVNVFVSSGDAGSNPDITGHNANGPTQAEYGASDPSVIGVGGTTLTLKSNGSVNVESGWASGGGGVSVFFDRPSWQTGSGVPAGTKRLIPDVAAAADPDTGAFLVFHGSVTQYGGTSWSAPVWAGFCALINEARLKAHKPALPFLNPLLYPLRGTPAFRDITTGSNGAFQAGAGYDLVTGLGVPNVKELIARLP
jgi:kumamolisin